MAGNFDPLCSLLISWAENSTQLLNLSNSPWGGKIVSPNFDSQIDNKVIVINNDRNVDDKQISMIVIETR